MATTFRPCEPDQMLPSPDVHDWLAEGLFARHASPTGPAFKAGDTVTLGVPWLIPHGELLPTFDLGDPREAAQAVVQAAVAD